MDLRKEGRGGQQCKNVAEKGSPKTEKEEHSLIK